MVPVRQQLVGVRRLVARARRAGRRSRGCAPRTSTPVPAGGRPVRRHPWPDSLRGAAVPARRPASDVWRGAARLRDDGACASTTDDGVGLAVEVDRERAGPAARPRLRRRQGGLRRPLPALAVDHTVVVVRPSRPRRERRRPTDLAGAYSFDRLVADTFAVADARRARPVPAARPLDGRDGRPPGRARRTRTGRGARPHGHRARPDARLRRRPHGRRRGWSRSTEGKAELKALLDAAAPLEHARVRAHARGAARATRSSRTEVGRAVGGDVGGDGRGDRAPGRRPPRAPRRSRARRS